MAAGGVAVLLALFIGYLGGWRKGRKSIKKSPS